MNWCINGNNYSQLDSGTTVKDWLPIGVYQLKFDDKHGFFYLVKMSEKFDFNYKIYGIENNFINRVLKTYNYTSGNLGILLYGLKGTGKTVTAKIIANRLENPCIIVNEYNPGMTEFLSSIERDCTIFFDEFEKIFGGDSDKSEIADLLSLMDGVYTSGGRKVYLLTCNDLNIEDSFLGRPSRIRYSKEFGNLSLDIVAEYLNDNLFDNSLTNNVIGLLNKLSIVTMDTIKCLVEEINIHECVNGILDDFNVEKQRFIYHVEYCEENKNWDINEFRNYLKAQKEQVNVNKFCDKLIVGLISLNKPIRELALNDSFYCNYNTYSILKTITEDGIIYCRDEDGYTRYIHVIDGGKIQPFFQNAY